MEPIAPVGAYRTSVYQPETSTFRLGTAECQFLRDSLSARFECSHDVPFVRFGQAEGKSKVDEI